MRSLKSAALAGVLSLAPASAATLKGSETLESVECEGAFLKEQGWHSRLVRGFGARGPEFDSRISHLCFDFFPFRVAK